MSSKTPTLGTACLSLKGHDKGKPYVVVKIIDPEFVFVADGRLRGVKNAKKKRFKHLRILPQSVNSQTLAAIALGTIDDNEIHKFLLTLDYAL